jgi:gamma-glutamyl-gamma-aminobutyraldehyde dehydrogenase
MMSDPVGATNWRQLAADATISEGMFIGGERRAAIDGSTRPVTSARDGSTLVNLAWAQPADADAAVAVARTAFDHGVWPRLHPRARGEILQHFADLVEEHRKEVALLISLEMGKPIRDAYQIELRALIRCLRFYGELADKESCEITPTEEGELSLVTREPAGVVAAVVPWNFPLTLGGWKLAPALAAGCTVVLKTAEQSPLSMQRVAELGALAGLPPGVFNVISGDGQVVGRHLGEHTDVDVLTFTGSTEVGRHFLRYSRTAISSGSISNSAASHPTSSFRTHLTWTRRQMRRRGRSTSTPVKCAPRGPDWWFMPTWPTGWSSGS